MPRIALAVAGVLFLLYPVLRPWDDETTAAGAHAAMSSSAWVVSHLFAMLGFVLVGLALLGLRDLVGTTPVAVMWAGAGLTLPYYGAEDFGLNAAANTAGTDLLAVAEATRYNPLAVAMFAVGLIALAVGDEDGDPARGCSRPGSCCSSRSSSRRHRYGSRTGC